MISTYTKDGFFRQKKHGPNSPDFKEQKNSKSTEFYDKFQICSQEYKKEFFKNNFTFIPSM